MNASLSAPALHGATSRPRVSIVGAGPGGLAAAMLLAARGARVTVFEKDEGPGGRSRVLRTADGYRFDLGPTFFLYPRILAEIFATCGYRLEDEVEMTQLDPLYRLHFEGSRPATLDCTADIDRMAEGIARLCPADAAGFRPFIEENRRKLAAFRPVLERPFQSMRDMGRWDMIRALPLLKPHRTVMQDLGRYFSDPRVRLAFSFQTKYLGMSPFHCPSMFTILSYLEYEHGIWHPKGGCGVVSEVMARLAERHGVEFRYGTPVDRVAFDGKQAKGVDAGGAHHAADAVVINADFAGTVPQLIPDALRGSWKDRQIEKARYSCSTFMLYLGIEGQLPGLHHHSVVLSEDYEENLRQIETGILPEKPSFYLHHGTATDPSLAPPGHSTLYMLIPVPNLRHGTDWAAEAPRYRALAYRRLADMGLTDIVPRVRFEKMLTPQGWRDDYAVGYGATFNLSHDFGQMLSFRPRNRFQGLQRLYLVGGGTHPGSGLPVIYEGARISSGLLAKDLGLAPIASGLPDIMAEDRRASMVGGVPITTGGARSTAGPLKTSGAD
jgi:phytoene desaturase